MGESAQKQVQRILQETTRRKAVWSRLEKIAREAVVAVTTEARRRGIRSQKWLGGTMPSESATLRFPTAETRRHIAAGTITHRLNAEHTLIVDASGQLRPWRGDPAYEGYLNVTDEDVEVFREVVVRALMGALNEYIAEARRRRQERR